MEGDPAAAQVPSPRDPNHNPDHRPSADGPARRHCWVQMPDADPIPGVVAGWRRADGGGWEARVAYILEDETGGVVIGWLPASILRPHDDTPAR